MSATQLGSHFNDYLVADYVPRLCIPNADSKDQRLYIKYKVWNRDKGRFVFSKDYEVNKIPESKREKFVKDRVRYYQKALKDGLQKSPLQLKADQHEEVLRQRAISLTISGAIEMGLKEKQSLNLKEIRNYEHRSRIFLKWLRSRRYDQMPANLFRAEKIKEFVAYLVNIRSCSNRTVNNYLTDISSLINVCVNNEYLDRNFFPQVQKKRVGIGKNWAYTKDQQKEILEYVRKHNPEFLMIIQFIYYTCARERELSLLKIEDIGKRHKDQIWFPEDSTKEFMERNIMIPDQLKAIIEENNLHSYPGHWYVFSKNFKPGPKYYDSDLWGKRYRRILKKIGDHYDFRHTLYSWKHTGITQLYKSGIGLGAIQQHIGHRSPYSLIKYLKTLGLEKDQTIVGKFPDLPI